jgi:hypothetical protein
MGQGERLLLLIGEAAITDSPLLLGRCGLGRMVLLGLASGC